MVYLRTGSSAFTVGAGTPRFLHVAQSTSVTPWSQTELIVRMKLRAPGGCKGFYFAQSEFDFLARPVTQPLGRTLPYTEVYSVVDISDTNEQRGTFYEST